MMMKSSDNLKWLKESEHYLYENNGGDLFYLLETMYKMEKMNFRQFIYDASRGIGNVICEGSEYVLDMDLDDPADFQAVTFFIGDYESSTISPKNFVELMRIISKNYIKENPQDKDSVTSSMSKLELRYL